MNGKDDADGVVFTPNDVRTIDLTLAPADMKTLTDQANSVIAGRISPFADRPKAKGTFSYKGAAIPVTPTCDVTKPYDVTVKIKGMASIEGFDRKPSLRIDFDTPFCGLKNLTFNSMVQDTSFVNELLAYSMYGAMSVTVPRTGLSTINVNGEGYGLYLTLETIDKNFLARKFGDGSGALYEGTYGGDLRSSDVGTPKLAFTGDSKDPEATDPQLLKSFIAAIDAPGDALFYGPTPLVDTNEFLAMMATAYVIGDWDNYVTANNYRLYRNPKTALWSFVPTGSDQTFAERLQPFRGFLARQQAFSILFEKCIGSERCLGDYRKQLDLAVQKLTANDAIAKMATERAGLIAAAVKDDHRRPQNDAAVANAQAGIPKFIAGRTADIAAATQCMSADGHELFPGACAGLIVRNAGAGRCLDNNGATPNDGALFIAYDCHGRTNQRVFAKLDPNGDYEIRMVHSDKCLDVPNLALTDDLQLMQFTCNGGPNQRFTPKAVAGGTQLVAKHSGKCLAIRSGDLGAAVVQMPCSGDTSQVWSLHRSLFD